MGRFIRKIRRKPLLAWAIPNFFRQRQATVAWKYVSLVFIDDGNEKTRILRQTTKNTVKHLVERRIMPTFANA